MAERLDSAWTVDEVMETYPQIALVFLALKTDCVGCYLKRFCTLEEVAAAYDLPLDEVLEKLLDAIPNSANRGE